jgi:GNAT superfamily N-acetyltransferase
LRTSPGGVNPSHIQIRHELRPGDIGRLVELHGLLYAGEYGFDYTFEAYVAKPLGEFVLQSTERERLWLVDADNILMGSMAIVRHDDTTAQLRWFLLHPDIRGKGLGAQLIADAVKFCVAQGYTRVFLWTVSALLAAGHLYRRAGFHLSEEKTHQIWGGEWTEQRYDLELSQLAK